MGLWFFIALMTGRRDAWDSSAFWGIGYPAAIVVSALLGYFFPARPWRWALKLFFAQFIAMMANFFGEPLYERGGLRRS